MGRNVIRVLGALAAAGVVAAVAIVASPPATAKRHTVARATLADATGTTVGTVEIMGRGRQAETVRVRIDAPGASPLNAFHGFHIHTTGLCDAPGFTTANGHWDLTSPDTMHSLHTGDMPSVLIGPDGAAEMRFDTARFDVAELFDADGSAVILHAGRDNFANIPNPPYGPLTEGTHKTGDAGSRYACGVLTP